MKINGHVRIVVIIAAFVVGTAQLDGGESLYFGEKEDWTNHGLVANEDGSLGLKGGQWICSAETFPVDPTAVSKLSGEFKKLPGASAQDRFFLVTAQFRWGLGKTIEAKIHVGVKDLISAFLFVGHLCKLTHGVILQLSNHRAAAFAC